MFDDARATAVTQSSDAVRVDPATFEPYGDFLAPDAWKFERQSIFMHVPTRMLSKGWVQQPNPTPHLLTPPLPPPSDTFHE
jgi:hypothetical protein